MKRYRVAQWGTGVTGAASLRALIGHPNLDLVGVKVYAEQKVGKDAGDLCGMRSTGVVATGNVEDIIRAHPDCVAYMPDRASADEMCQLLEAGINIVTPCLRFNHRDSIEPAERSRLEAACSTGQSTLYATGASPGWGTEIMPLVLSIMQRRFDRLTITDYSDMSALDFSARMMFDRIHFGAYPDSLDPNEPFGTGVSTPPTLSAAAQALGMPIEEFRFSREFARTRKRVELSMGTVEVGTVGGIRMQVDAMRGGKVLIQRRTIWYVTTDIEADWDLRESGFRYQLQGDVPLDVLVRFDVPEKEYPAMVGSITANPVVNAISYVCDASPGIRETHELPMLLPVFAS